MKEQIFKHIQNGLHYGAHIVNLKSFFLKQAESHEIDAAIAELLSEGKIKNGAVIKMDGSTEILPDWYVAV